MSLPDYADIAAAVQRIAPFAVKTPLLSSPRLNALMGGEILVKALTRISPPINAFRRGEDSRGVLTAKGAMRCTAAAMSA